LYVAAREAVLRSLRGVAASFFTGKPDALLPLALFEDEKLSCVQCMFLRNQRLQQRIVCRVVSRVRS
jgi:hypothetical protein